MSQNEYDQKVLDEKNAYEIYNINLDTALNNWTERII
jgi:hypothetical protein